MARHDLLTGNIKKHMLRMAIPNIGGMFAIILFNITDTYFVSKLGVKPLAAMGFTFPVVMVIGAVSSGISMGASSILARAFGKKNEHLMSRIATDGILLSVITVVIISTLGLSTITPLFKVLGAEENIIPLIRQYMTVWYSGVIFVVMPPVSDSCMRAIGDMKRPFYVMLVCAVVNIILDPIFIFKLNMGIKGAAIATLISRCCGGLLSIGFLKYKYNLINFKYKSISELFLSWKDILSIGIPGALVRLLPQVARVILTKLSAVTGGTLAVAAIAAGSRIESFSSVVSMAVGVTLIPIMGQNFGAGNHGRVEESRRLILRLSIIFSIVLTTLAVLFWKPLGGIFTNDPVVLNYIRDYLIILMIGALGLNLYNWISEGLVALGRAKLSLKINTIGTLFVIIPSTYIGSKLYGFRGMIIGLAIGQILIGIVAELIGKKAFK